MTGVSRPVDEAGWLIPRAGDQVVQQVPGPFGTPAYVSGEVYAASNGVMRVRITGGGSIFGSPIAGVKTTKLTPFWRVKDDPEFQRREDAERQRREDAERQRREDAEAERQALVEAKASWRGKGWTEVEFLTPNRWEVRDVIAGIEGRLQWIDLSDRKFAMIEPIGGTAVMTPIERIMAAPATEDALAASEAAMEVPSMIDPSSTSSAVVCWTDRAGFIGGFDPFTWGHGKTCITNNAPVEHLLMAYQTDEEGVCAFKVARSSEGEWEVQSAGYCSMPTLTAMVSRLDAIADGIRGSNDLIAGGRQTEEMALVEAGFISTVPVGLLRESRGQAADIPDLPIDDPIRCAWIADGSWIAGGSADGAKIAAGDPFLAASELGMRRSVSAGSDHHQVMVYQTAKNGILAFEVYGKEGNGRQVAPISAGFIRSDSVVLSDLHVRLGSLTSSSDAAADATISRNALCRLGFLVAPGGAPDPVMSQALSAVRGDVRLCAAALSPVVSDADRGSYFLASGPLTVDRSGGYDPGYAVATGVVVADRPVAMNVTGRPVHVRVVATSDPAVVAWSIYALHPESFVGVQSQGFARAEMVARMLESEDLRQHGISVLARAGMLPMQPVQIQGQSLSVGDIPRIPYGVIEGSGKDLGKPASEVVICGGRQADGKALSESAVYDPPGMWTANPDAQRRGLAGDLHVRWAVAAVGVTAYQVEVASGVPVIPQPVARGYAAPGQVALAIEAALAARTGEEALSALAAFNLVDASYRRSDPAPVEGGSDVASSSSPQATSDGGVAGAPVASATSLGERLWRIGPEVEGVRGLKTRIRANLDAIDAIKRAEMENRSPTRDERSVIARFSGWGAMPMLFSPAGGEPYESWEARGARTKSYEELEPERNRLRSLLSNVELSAAADSTINSHYTDYPFVRGIWSAIDRMGFSGGNVLEGSAGIGRFIGTMPDHLAERSSISAVEMDPLVGSMLRALYPSADVRVQPFQQFAMPPGFYDLALSNVPFSNTVIRQDKEFKSIGPVLHDYCIAKAMSLVRPGGLGVFITSTGTMDKNDQRVRSHLSATCDLLAAIRLPDGAFAEAGTAVVTDLLFLRRRLPGEPSNGVAWLDLAVVETEHGAARINRYYAEHPKQILGTLDLKSRLYGGDEPHVTMTGDFQARWESAMAGIPAGVYRQNGESISDRRRHVAVAGAEGTRKGSYVIDDDGVIHQITRYQVMDDGEVVLDSEVVTCPAKRTGETSESYARRAKQFSSMIEIVSDLIPIRDGARSLLRAQVNQEPTAVMRSSLNDCYDHFVEKHGPLHLRGNVSAFAQDPDAQFVLGIELWDPATKKASKSDLFHRDTVRPTVAPVVASTLEEGIGQSLNEYAAIRIDVISSRLGRSEDDVRDEVIRRGLAFVDPSTKRLIDADEYLSGDVRAKLRMAKMAVAVSPDFAGNVTALEKVIPADIPYDEIDVKLGAPWIPAGDIKDFCVHMVGGISSHYDIKYIHSIGEWVVGNTGAGEYNCRESVKATQIHGTYRAPFIDCLKSAIVGRPIVVRDSIDGVSVVNNQETEAANAKVAELMEVFSDWIWSDGGRRDRLHRYYNDHYNCIRLRSYDGSHLTFPGMLAIGEMWGGRPFNGLRPHQRNAVWQGIVRGNAAWGHEVGTGKTITMVATAMELRRLGLARKPCIVCLKANIASVTEDAQRLYPGAKIISAYEEFDAKSRRETVAKIASGDWDIVVIGHSQLAKIPVSPSEQAKYISARLSELNEAIAESIGDSQDSRDPNSVTGDLSDRDVSRSAKRNPTVKQLAKMRERLKEKLKDLLNAQSKDTSTSFEETGIDALIVDEAHHFKSLPVYSRMGSVKGMPTGDSQAAVNLEMIASFLRRTGDGRGLFFATGTPVVNTMAETYIIQRFIQPEELENRGIYHFDAWAKTFTSITTRMEFTHTGDYAPVSRLRQFVNLPELQSIAYQDLDSVRADEVNEIVRPKRNDIPVVIPATSEMVNYMAELRERAKNLGSDKTKDNHLKIATDGRKAAVDLRLVDSSLIGDPSIIGKADYVADKVAQISRANPGKTQMIFSDIGKSGETGFSVIDHLVGRLVENGIDRRSIVLFSELTDATRVTAIEKLDNGEYLVGIGSTDTMGTGVNAQRNLIALHHMDAPWTPSETEQRNGRAWRQGNLNPEIGIYTYLSERSLDSWFWQTVARKDRFIKAFMSKSGLGRVIKEDNADDLSYEKLMAISSGNPLLFERMNVENDIGSLERAQRRFNKTQESMKSTLVLQEKALSVAADSLSKAVSDAESYRKFRESPFVFISTNGVAISDKDEAISSMVSALTASRRYGSGGFDIGQIGPFKLRVSEKYYNDGTSYFSGGIMRVDDLGAPVGELREVNVGCLLATTKDGGNEEAKRIWGNVTYALQTRLANESVSLRRNISNIEQAISSLKSEIGKPFKGADDLAALRATLARIDIALSEGRMSLAPSGSDNDVSNQSVKG